MKLKKIESRQTTAKYVSFIELKPAEQKAILKRAKELDIELNATGDITGINYDTFQIPDTIQTKIKSISFKEPGKYSVILEEPVYYFNGQTFEWLPTFKVTVTFKTIVRLLDESPLIALVSKCLEIVDGVAEIKNASLFEILLRKFTVTVNADTLFDNNGDKGFYRSNPYFQLADDCTKLSMVSQTLIDCYATNDVAEF